MGMSPDQVDACALWKFMAAFRGWQKANSPNTDIKPSMSTDEILEQAAEAGIVGM